MSDVNWEEIALELQERVIFAMSHLECPHYRGTGLVYNREEHTTQTWQRYFAEGLALIPGMKIDWEVVEALSLPAKQRKAFFAEHRKKKAESEAV